MAKNISASVRAKLLVIAKKSNRNFDAVVVQYFQERFLYRLSISEFKENFVLKGAMLFRIYKIPASRPTVDIDFLGQNTDNSIENLTKLMREIISIECPDGVTFDEDSITAEIIKENDDYPGIRIFCLAFLGKAKTRLHFDIGFGDKVIPSPALMDFPVLLENSPIPEIVAYSPESAIAEKFQAIVSLGLYTSRLKDFFDIYYMSQNFPFSSKILSEAIETTFKNRETDINNKNNIFAEDFKNDLNKAQQWNAFLNRINSELTISFHQCVDYIEMFLNPILTNVLDNHVWDKSILKWHYGDNV